MVGYYVGARAYRALGPPVMFLRLLGPVIAVLTILLLGSGVILVVGPTSVHASALLVHKASFYLWLLAAAVHVVPHFVEAFRLASKDWIDRFHGRVSGAPIRVGAVLSSVAIGILIALALANTAPTYQQHYLEPSTPAQTPVQAA
jgi:hypothetical protein